jgi:hypothetical protein
MNAGLVAIASGLLTLINLTAEEWRFPCPENEIARYTAFRVSEPMRVDGRLDESAWQRASRSPRFVDILTGGPARYDTHASVLWDTTNLYVAFRVEEPLVCASLTNRNAPIWQENDVELFIAGRDAYYEFEINARNTTYEVFFIWADAYERGGFPAAEFERGKLRPFNGVGFTNHPHGKRLGQFNWHFPGLHTAVFVDGTLNDNSDRDRGWTVELALPWRGLEWLAKTDSRALPPKHDEVWRLDFSRFNRLKAALPAQDSGGWAWSRHGVWDSHIPECFPFITFSTNDVSAIRNQDSN